MINKIFKLLQNPNKGWDPVPQEYSKKYSLKQWESYDETILTDIENKIGPFDGKKILDLGGGPGQFSVGMAKLGGDVTWLDISNNYLSIMREKAEEHGVDIKYHIAYMDDALNTCEEQSFDFIFNRICWYYCIDDKNFCDMIVKLLKSGGSAYLNIYTLDKSKNSLFRNLLQNIYALTNLKIGHLLPPKGKIPAMFSEYNELTISKVQTTERNEEFFIFKNH